MLAAVHVYHVGPALELTVFFHNFVSVIVRYKYSYDPNNNKQNY